MFMVLILMSRCTQLKMILMVFLSLKQGLLLQMQRLRQQVDPLAISENYAIELYERTLQILASSRSA